MNNAEIRKYYLFQALHSAEFFGPVIAVFWMSHGLSMTQIMLLQSSYAIATVFLELPTGAFADRFGKKISLSIGLLSAALGMFFYGMSGQYWQFLLSEIVIAFGYSFISGADSAFIHEILKQQGREQEFSKVEGRARSLGYFTRAVCYLFSGLIATFSLSLTLIATGVSNLLSFFVTLTFAKHVETEPRHENTNYLQIIKDGVSLTLRTPEVLMLTVFFACFNSIVHINMWFSQPYMQFIGIPVIYFGFVASGFNVLNVVASSVIDKIEAFAKSRIFALLVAASVVSLFLLTTVPSMAMLPLFGVLISTLTISQVTVTRRVLGLIPSERAATVISFQNLIRRFTYALIGPLFGLAADQLGIIWALRINMLALIAFFGLFLLFKSRSIRTAIASQEVA